jgi:hypothetical protein
MKTIGILAANIIGAVILAILAAETALFAYCTYISSRSCHTVDNAMLVGGTVTLAVLISFSWVQFVKTRELLSVKRPRELPVSVKKVGGSRRPHKLFSVFASVAEFMWEGETHGGSHAMAARDYVDQLEDFGWIIQYANGAKDVVTRREFYYWLLDVVKLQQEYEGDELSRMRSPVGQRAHIGNIGRSRHKLYMHILKHTQALRMVNRNVAVLKDEYFASPWDIIRAADDVFQVVEC